MESEKDWYKIRKKHWEEKEATLESVLGGWEDTNLPDIKCSNELLNGLILTKKLNNNSALDCACGIGRVTQFVLCNFFNEIDYLKKMKNSLIKLKKYLNTIKKLKIFFVVELKILNLKGNMI